MSEQAFIPCCILCSDNPVAPYTTDTRDYWLEDLCSSCRQQQEKCRKEEQLRKKYRDLQIDRDSKYCELGNIMVELINKNYRPKAKKDTE